MRRRLRLPTFAAPWDAPFPRSSAPRPSSTKPRTASPATHNGLATLTFHAARERGVPLDETSARDVAAKGLSKLPDFLSIDRAVQANMIIDPVPSDGWALIAADAAGIPRNPILSVYARRIANWQRADGRSLPSTPVRRSRTARSPLLPSAFAP